MKNTMFKTTVLTVALILATTALAFAQQYAPEGDFVTAPNPGGGGIAIIGYNGRGGAVSIPPTIAGQPVVQVARGFTNNTNITSIIIPNSVTQIGSFQGMTRLQSVTLGNGITLIPQNAFRGCIMLTSVTIGTSVTRIMTSAFDSCTGLSSITIPASVTAIETGAFYGCSNLRTITILRESTGSSFTGTELGQWEEFEGTSTNLQIRVPANSRAAYQAAANWSTHARRIQ